MCSSGITESQHDDKHGIINDIVLMLYIFFAKHTWQQRQL